MELGIYTRQDTRQLQKQKFNLNQQQKQSLIVLETSASEMISYLSDEVMENPLIKDINPQISLSMPGIQNPMRSLSTFSEAEKDMDAYEDNHAASLWESLVHQVKCYRDTPLRALVLQLVPLIDERGFLRGKSTDLLKQLNCEPIALEDAIVLLQQLEPYGIGARDLRECWLLQMDQDAKAPEHSYTIVEQYFDDLVKRNFSRIAEGLGISKSDVETCINYYQKLSASPGLDLVKKRTQYIVPDVYLMRSEATNDFMIQYNDSFIPSLSFDQLYYNELSGVNDKEVKNYVKNMKKSFESLSLALERRKKTLLVVTNCIVSNQLVFFLSKGHKKNPLKLKDIADECDLHISTVSRAIKDKYIYTDFGIFSYSDLLENETLAGSSTFEIKNQIAKLIDEEDKEHSLSDQKLVELLAKDHIYVARRTVAKYREELNILSAAKRKLR
ncbi:RNA polymerase sigma-54 factor [Lactococcus lactis]|uniref:RNA polymerase factor sigma-54 n=1 Tax=Lactococcus lactis TaxID=1358 RepID=UPI0021A30AA9|nr:RNA polymerase factor sigma-54 [Lactococcus lactis]MCT3091779.1 RNA polymerase sigma-54 factor [Lactococcus lactis]